MEVLKSMPNFAPHFHLSLQSGDEHILKKMNRHYTPDEFFEKTKLIREYFPDANLTTDVIVGFAGETQEQFDNTKAFIEKVGFSYVHVFPYSKREGTRAYSFEDLPMQTKKQRVAILEELNKTLKSNYLSKFLGRKGTVLIEEKKTYFEGFSPEYIRCYLDDVVECSHIYDIEFVELFEDGIKVKLV